MTIILMIMMFGVIVVTAYQPYGVGEESNQLFVDSDHTSYKAKTHFSSKHCTVIPNGGNEESFSANSCKNWGGANQSDYMCILQQIRLGFTKTVNS